MKSLKIFKVSIIIIPIIILLIGIFCNYQISQSAKGKTFDDIAQIPYQKVALLLGTSKYLSDGSINLYYQYRIDAALKIIKSKKCKYIVISGDNKQKSYNEPEMMRQDLIAGGIDSNMIILDYAGFRTFDSITRLKKVFGQNKFTIISQKFHNERALFIAAKEHMAAIAFNATDVNKHAGIKTKIREKLARVKAYLDYILGQKPKFLGPQIIIPD